MIELFEGYFYLCTCISHRRISTLVVTWIYVCLSISTTQAESQGGNFCEFQRHVLTPGQCQLVLNPTCPETTCPDGQEKVGSEPCTLTEWEKAVLLACKSMKKDL